MKDLKIDVDFADTCINFGKYVYNNRVSLHTDLKDIDQLWNEYQGKITERVFKELTQDKSRVMIPSETVEGLTDVIDENKINPKMLLTKEELSYAERKGGVKSIFIVSEKKDDRIPSYYIGTNGYEARKVVDGFDLSYNVGTAVTYLLRAERKHDSPVECIEKAINHLQFELDKLKND